MADRPSKKPSSQKRRNDNRKNGKAFKKPGASRVRTAPLTELQKALLGGGVMRRITRPAPEKASSEH